MRYEELDSQLVNLPPIQAVAIACSPVIENIRRLQLDVEFDERPKSIYQFAQRVFRDLKRFDKWRNVPEALDVLRLVATNQPMRTHGGQFGRTWAEVAYQIGREMYLAILHELNWRQWLKCRADGGLYEVIASREKRQNDQPIWPAIVLLCQSVPEVNPDFLRAAVEREFDIARSTGKNRRLLINTWADPKANLDG